MSVGPPNDPILTVGGIMRACAASTKVLALGLITAAALSIQACATTQDLTGPRSLGPDIMRASVSPRSARLFVGDSLAVLAYGLLQNGDSTRLTAVWSATGGSISADGWFRANQSGRGTVRAVSVAQPTMSDSAAYDVATIELSLEDTLVSAGGSIQVTPRAILPDGSVITPAVTWSATRGTISSTGLFSAPADSGTYAVTAQVTGHAATASRLVKVTPATLQSLVLSPSSVSLVAGTTRQFSLAARWSNGSSALPVVTWSATGGIVSSSGLYTAGLTAGVFRVIAAANGRADTSIVTISVTAPTLTQLVLSPKTLTLTPSGATQYAVSGTWSDGSSTTPGVTYSATGGTITSTGFYTAGTTLGTYRVIAAQTGGTKADTATVTISMPVVTLVTLALNPHAFTIQPGATQQFSVAGGWSDGTTTAPAVTYSATGGMITATGLYTAGATPGTFRVIATQQGGSKVDTAAVTITSAPPTLTQMVLSPASLLLTTGTTGQFSVTGTWSDGTTSAPQMTYSATGGTITANGLYTAGATPGTFRVIATQQGGAKVDTAVVTITALSPTLTQMVLSPATLSLAVGATGQFSVTGTWSDGTTTAPLVTYSATGGTITAAGLYTAGATPGVFRVVATQQGGTKVDTAAVSITVVPPTLTQMVLSPATLSLVVGTTGQFSVTGTWSDGTTTAPVVSYSVTGGTITAAGLYTAGATPGAFRVIATQQGGTKVDTAAVTITAVPPTLTQMVLSPASVALAPAGTAQFTVAGTWSDGTSSTPAVTYSATGGTITAGGLYTAGATAGTFRVIATQTGGTKVDTSTVTVTAPAAIALALVAQPVGTISGSTFAQQPVVELRNAQNQPVLQSGVVVTASLASGTGLLSGPLSSITNVQGRALFTGLQITGAGTYTIAFSAPGLTTVTSIAMTLATPTLRSLATARGFSIGAAVRDTAYSRDTQYRRTLATQYNSIVPEDATDFWPIHPGPTQYSFAAADTLVNFAQANGMAFHGHHLAWYAWIPTWVTAGGYSDAQLDSILKAHITTVVSRYRGKVASWDAVNEIENDAGTGLRSSFWVDHLGPSYIDSAFVWAHRADPSAKLYLMDYATETINPKSTAILALAQALRARGVPIDGVGFQTHILQQYYPLPTSAQVQANFQRFADAGFDIRITEMDVDIPDAGDAAALATQATVYSDILNACLSVSRCHELTTWGFSDKYSYVPASFPGYGRALPFDINFQPKPAFNALLARLGLP